MIFQPSWLWTIPFRKVRVSVRRAWGLSVKIGILSDTHNDAMMTHQAIELFKERKVDLIIHAGDIGSSSIIDMFRGSKTKFVLGNCDTDHEGISKSCVCVGLEPAARCTSFDLEGKHFFVCHGDDLSRYRDAINSKQYDYLIVGHTHEFSAAHKGNTLVINPGAVTRDNHSEFLQTVAILDVDSGAVERVLLDNTGCGIIEDPSVSH